MSVSRMPRWRAVLVVGLAMVLTACERPDARLEQLTVGISKDSVLRIMGGTPERIDPVLVKGQYIEPMYFAKPGASDPDSRLDRNMSPVVLIQGTLAGWGWNYWDSVATQYKIQVAPRE
jgi:hypothetical protein